MANISEGGNGATNGSDPTSTLNKTATEPQAKKRRINSDSSTSQQHQDEGEEWQIPTRRQLKKMMKKKNKEKKKHQEMEDKYAATAFQSPDCSLNARQSDILKSLVSMACGKQCNCLNVQKIKTVHFQNTISHILIDYPPVREAVEGVAQLRSDYRVVVLWLSMISAEFFKGSPNHFPKMKKLLPHVMFDIEHPGSSTFVKLGLESFMMVSSDDYPLPVASTQSSTSNGSPPRYSYLFSQNKLSDNGFPNPSRGDVDELGHHIDTYTSITEWPSTEIDEAPQVMAAREGEGEGMPMFAIDCEMVETKNGSELARISIVDEELKCIYDTYAKPVCPVVDYRTRFSGISESILEDVTTTLKDIQDRISLLLPPNSILIGHSLENDFHAIKFRHPFVIDTSLLFTPFATPTSKPGLRKVCKELLSTDIQSSGKGHDSIEDATVCMKLVHLKLKKGGSCKIFFNEINPSIFTEYRTRGCVTGIVDKDSVVRLFGKGSTHSVEVKTDEEAVAKAIDIIPQSKFTFVQFHNIEYLLKSEKPAEKETLLEKADIMDANVIQVVENCPPKTIVFIACGSSDIRKVRSLQQQEYADFGQLKKQVMFARTGCVIGVVKN